jgi:hypothetical protein
MRLLNETDSQKLNVEFEDIILKNQHMCIEELIALFNVKYPDIEIKPILNSGIDLEGNGVEFIIDKYWTFEFYEKEN